MTLILFIGFHFFLNKIDTPDYFVKYEFKWIKDTTTVTYSTPEEYILFKINKESRFLNSNAYNNDTVHLNAELRRKQQQSFMLEGNLDERKHVSGLRVLKNFETNTSSIVLYETYNRHYLKEPLNLKWETIAGVDTIAGIPCYKAKTNHGGRQYTAWYAPQIPIQDGPYIFHGLPGLITKVVDDDRWYHFKVKDYKIQPTEKFQIPPFITESFKQKIDRKIYVKETKRRKTDPEFPVWMPNITPEKIMALKEKRKTRFDLLIEKQ